MGHKVNPKVFRLNTTASWNSKWFASAKALPRNIREDYAIRKFIKAQLPDAGIANVEIERTNQEVQVMIHTSKPGIVIGRGGAGIEELLKKIKNQVLMDRSANIKLNVKEVSDPKLVATLVAQGLVQDIERRMPFRRACKRTLESVVKAGARGVKIIVSGRLDGAEIARSEKFQNGTVPLHTLRADIDYGRTAAFTTYGAVGIKVWIYKGEVFQKKGKAQARPSVAELMSEEPQKKARRYPRNQELKT